MGGLLDAFLVLLALAVFLSPLCAMTARIMERFDAKEDLIGIANLVIVFNLVMGTGLWLHIGGQHEKAPDPVVKVVQAAY